MLAVICSILMPPLLYAAWGDRLRDRDRAACPHRHRLRCGFPGRPIARRHRVQLAAPASLVARAGVRLAGGHRARQRDLLQRRLRAAFAVVGPDDAFALEPAPLFGVMAASAPRWVSWASATLAVKLIIAVFGAHSLPADRGTLEPARAGGHDPRLQVAALVAASARLTTDSDFPLHAEALASCDSATPRLDRVY